MPSPAGEASVFRSVAPDGFAPESERFDESVALDVGAVLLLAEPVSRVLLGLPVNGPLSDARLTGAVGDAPVAERLDELDGSSV
jgi:hypothetical protein